MNKKIKAYFLTFFVALFVTLLVATALELELLFRCENTIYKEKINYANLEKYTNIRELETKIIQEPNNYFLRIKLAQIYESYGNIKTANEYYKKALEISGNSNFSIYNYAIFCAKQKLFTLSSSLCEQLEGNSKTIIEYKAKIYETLGDNFALSSEIPASNKAFQIAYKYAKNMHDKKYYNQIREKFSNSYVALADLNIKEDNFDEAIINLKNSLKIKDNTLAKYKLGLIYKNIDLIKAEKYIFEVFKENPFMVNPYIYNDISKQLTREMDILQNHSRLEYYKLRFNRFQKQLKNSYIYKDDINVSNIKLSYEKKLFQKEKEYFLTFTLGNQTALKISDLFLKVVIFTNNEKHAHHTENIIQTNEIKPYEELENVRINLKKEINFKDIPKKEGVILKIYAKKHEKAPWTLIEIGFLNF